MTPLRDELHEIVDRLPDYKIAEVLKQLKTEVIPAQISLGDWLDGARTLRAEMQSKYGERAIPNTAEIINEIREDRLNDLMGGE